MKFTTRLLLTATCLFLAVQAFAQELYIPRNIKLAYQNETRDSSGLPGKNYWQNGGKYQVQVEVDPSSATIRGNENILYSNNSPDALKTLAIRFVNNHHKPQAPRTNYVAEDYLSEGLTIKSMKIDGIAYEVDNDFGTVTSIRLKTPIMAHSQTKIEMEWEYPLSKKSDREGQIDSTTFYAAYSYPRVSVYDDYNGWDLIPHYGRQEFYNDYNDYEFEISVPANYLVWATGDLLNPEEVLQKEYLKRYQKSLKSDAVITVSTEAELKKGLVTAQKARNIWKFKADHLTDFTFATSDHYVWDASSVALADKRVSVQAGYKTGAPDFEQYVSWLQGILKFFSAGWPGVEYPYPKMSAIQGFADMEYPMMVNDSTVPDDLVDAHRLLAHEVAHTYFPFYVGINEKRYAYMDEGFAVLFEYLNSAFTFGAEQEAKNFANSRIKRWISTPIAEHDQPIITMTSQLAGAGYSYNAYGKPALSHLALKDLLGDELFKEALHFYMDAWKGKHPIPWDFFNSFNTASGKDLNWFWNNWYFTNSYIDLRVEQAAQQAGKLNLTLVNEGGFAIPFDVVLHYEDGTTSSQHFTPEVWKSQEKKITLSVSVDKKVKEVVADGGVFLDYTEADNRLKL